MSYELIYAKQFIKVKENKFIPIVLGGSSNCYDSFKGKERRSRSWFNIRTNGNEQLALSLNEMLVGVELERNLLIKRNNENLKDDANWDKYDDKSFGYFNALAIGGRHTSNTTFGQYKGLFTDGVKKALTVEQLMKFHISVSLNVFTPSFDKELEAEVLELQKQFGTVTTSEELNKKLELFETLRKERITLTVKLNAINDAKVLKPIHKHFFPKVIKEKTEVEIDKYFVITIKGNYFNRLLKRGYRYGYSQHNAKIFTTLPLAEKMVKKLIDKGYKDEVEIETVKQKTKIYK